MIAFLDAAAAEQRYVGRTVDVSETSELRATLLQAIVAQDADALELAIRKAYSAGLPAELVDIFTDALLLNWHTRHEDLASALQKLRSPSSIEALTIAATTAHPYLDYDEFFGLARKCTWALADIGTPQARESLHLLATNPNPNIAAYARKRLDRWEEELHRKGA